MQANKTNDHPPYQKSVFLCGIDYLSQLETLDRQQKLGSKVLSTNEQNESVEY